MLELDGLRVYYERGEKKRFVDGASKPETKLWETKKEQALKCAEWLQEESSRIKTLRSPPVKLEKPTALLSITAVPGSVSKGRTPLLQSKTTEQLVTAPSSGQEQRSLDALSSNGDKDSMPSIQSTTKKRKSSDSVTSSSKALPSRAECESFVNSRVCKYFWDPPTLFFGSVAEFSMEEGLPLWHVVYDDDDSEDLSWKELRKSRSLYASLGGSDPTPNRRNKRVEGGAR